VLLLARLKIHAAELATATAEIAERNGVSRGRQLEDAIEQCDEAETLAVHCATFPRHLLARLCLARARSRRLCFLAKRSLTGWGGYFDPSGFESTDGGEEGHLEVLQGMVGSLALSADGGSPVDMYRAVVADLEMGLEPARENGGMDLDLERSLLMEAVALYGAGWVPSKVEEHRRNAVACLAAALKVGKTKLSSWNVSLVPICSHVFHRRLRIWFI
jgi:hypothetical protein